LPEADETGWTEFHDALIVAVARTGEDLSVDIEGADTSEGSWDGVLTFRGVGAIEVDGQPAGELMKEGEDADIYSLDFAEGVVSIFAKWTVSYRPLVEIYRSYRIGCRSLDWSKTRLREDLSRRP
jgi:hypothetical protein